MWSSHVCNLTDQKGEEITRPRWPYELQDIAGYSFAISILIILGVNLVIMMRSNMAAARNKKRLIEEQTANRIKFNKEKIEKSNNERLRLLTAKRQVKMEKKFAEEEEKMP